MLTDRELEVLKLRKAGKTQAEIAKHLGITQPAVSNFDRNAQRKISQAKDLLETLKKLGLLALAFLFFPLFAAIVSAVTPNPGHEASSVGAGTFDTGDFAFQNNLSVNGTLFLIDSSGATLRINSSAAAGSFIVQNTSNYYSIFVNGSSGRVGIGNNNPNYTLDVSGTLNVSTILYVPQICLSGDCETAWPSTSANVTSLNGTAGYLARFTSATNINTGALYDDGSGHIGLGILTPSSVLHINSSAAAGILIVQNTSNYYSIFVNGTSGRVGIGNSEPNATLHVAGTINGTTIYATAFQQGPNTVLDVATNHGGDVSGTYDNLQLAVGSVGASELGATTVTAGNYGNATVVATFTVDADGRITAASNATIAAGNVTSGNGTAGYFARFTTSTNVNAGALYDDGSGKIGINTASPTQALHVGGSLNVTGTIYYGGNLTGYGADFAEAMSKAEDVLPGDVVCLTSDLRVRKCRAHADSSVAGVVSTQATIIGNGAAPNSVPVGIVGIVPTKVRGPLPQFALLTTSATPGYAQAASAQDFGAIIGKAMQACTATECTVHVLVGLR